MQFLGLAVLGFLLVILVSSVSSTLPALFPRAVRYTGFALAYNFSTAFFAGPSQTIANQLIETIIHGSNRACWQRMVSCRLFAVGGEKGFLVLKAEGLVALL